MIFVMKLGAYAKPWTPIIPDEDLCRRKIVVDGPVLINRNDRLPRRRRPPMLRRNAGTVAIVVVK